MDLYRNFGIIRYHYGYSKDMLFSVIRPFKVPLILTYSFGNTFQSKSMEVYIIFCGNQPPPGLFGRFIATVAENDNTICVAVDSIEYNPLRLGLLCCGDGIIQKVPQNGYQINIVQLRKLAHFNIMLKSYPS